jgi:hypothetical protein
MLSEDTPSIASSQPKGKAKAKPKSTPILPPAKEQEQEQEQEQEKVKEIEAETETGTAPDVAQGKKIKFVKVRPEKFKKWIKAIQDQGDFLKEIRASSCKALNSIVDQMSNAIDSNKKNNTRALSEYNEFVREHIGAVAAANTELSNKEVMTLIAKSWREQKAAKSAASATAAVSLIDDESKPIA